MLPIMIPKSYHIMQQRAVRLNAETLAKEMSKVYYFAANTDGECIIGCIHEHRTVTNATACISSAGGYVVAVENMTLRALTDAEEAEFQAAMYGNGEVHQHDSSRCTVFVRVRLGFEELN